MRIVAGKYGGRQIKTVNSKTLRPTTDRVREAMFSSLISIFGRLDNCEVLDAYAGSGALGIEAISRGAKSCTAFEKDKNTYRNLLDNYNLLSIDTSKIYNLDITKVNFENLCQNNKFALLFFDPPYKMDTNAVLDVLNKLICCDCLSNKAVLVYEHTQKNNWEDDILSFENIGFIYNKDKHYGDTIVSFFRFDRGKNE